MRIFRLLGSGLAGLAALPVFCAVLLVEIGGISYRKDCLTPQGTVKSSWTFTWLPPILFVFRPSETGCIVHVGTRVALNAIGIDSFKPSTPDLLAQQQAGVVHDSYWPVLSETVTQLLNVPRTADLTTHLAALDKAVAKLSSLKPPAAYKAAHTRFVSSVVALDTAGHRLQRALLNGDRAAATRIINSQKILVARFAVAGTELQRLHSAQ